MQRFGRQHVNGSQTLLRSARNEFHTTPPLISVRRSSKRVVLVRFELLGQFVNTLAADHKYSRQNWEQTSLKLKTCSQFFNAPFKSTLKLEYFEKKDKSHSLSINEIINCERGSHLNVQKSIFHATLRQTTY